MNKNYTPHDYKFAKALQEAIAQDVENKKDLFTNPQDARWPKKSLGDKYETQGLSSCECQN